MHGSASPLPLPASPGGNAAPPDVLEAAVRVAMAMLGPRTVSTRPQGACPLPMLTVKQTAALIDEIPVLAAIAPHTEEGIEVRDAKELRVKESDRIAALATNLRAMGAQVEELEDGLRIPGGQSLRGAELESFGDHRIAMAFSIAALRAKGETLIRGSECAAISYPAFFSTLEGLVER